MTTIRTRCRCPLESRSGRRRADAVLAFAVVLGACGGGQARSKPVVEQPGTELVTSLCDATGRAGAGDPAAARLVFFDRAHQPIHELAAAHFAGPDRAAAAHLLETTQRVEADLGDRGVTERLAEDLTAVADAARAIPPPPGQPPPPPCRGGTR